jgi:hypothetical protein
MDLYANGIDVDQVWANTCSPVFLCRKTKWQMEHQGPAKFTGRLSLKRYRDDEGRESKGVPHGIKVKVQNAALISMLEPRLVRLRLTIRNLYHPRATLASWEAEQAEAHVLVYGKVAEGKGFN